MAANWKEVIAVADKLEPSMRRAFLQAVDRLRARVHIGRLLDQLASGRSFSAATMAEFAVLEADLEPALDVVFRAFQLSGTVTAKKFLEQTGVAMRFDLTNPQAVEVARNTAAQFVSRVSGETRAAIRGLVTTSIEDGIEPLHLSKLIRPMIGLTRGGTQAVLNYRRSLIEMGLNQAMVIKRTREYAAKLVRERALTIARTELMFAINDGQSAAWRQAVEKGLLDPASEEEWLVTPDDRLCLRCRRMRGARATIGGLYPPGVRQPLHPRCRCTKVLRVPGSRRRTAA